MAFMDSPILPAQTMRSLQPPLRERLHPRFAAYLLATLMSLWFAYDLMRKPIQVSDSFMELLDVQQSPSLAGTFAAHSPRGPFLRPMRQVQIKLLFDAARGRYQLAFRGFHAFLVAAALLLFVRALRVSTWADFAAAAFAVTVLTGIHTFRGTVREAFPINHFLEIVVFCLLALNLAQSKGGMWVDLAAAATLFVASFTLESGPLVWVIVAAAWIAGLRGISTRGVVLMTIVLGGYLWFRFVYLSIGSPGLEGRDSGFGVRMLDAAEIQQRFGANPIWFYSYNVVTQVLSVLFSDPDRGVFNSVRTWMEGEVTPRVYIAVVPSLLTTGAIAWMAIERIRGRARDLPAASQQLILIFGAVLVANAVISYPYAKHEIISVAGAFYAFAAFAAARFAIERAQSPALSSVRRFAICGLLAAMAALWAFRSAGVHYMIQTQAFRERVEWARLDPSRLAERTYRSDAQAQALATQLRGDALNLRLPNPSRIPSWADRWWGE
jgi:hypothetical protein